MNTDMNPPDGCTSGTSTDTGVNDETTAPPVTPKENNVLVINNKVNFESDDNHDSPGAKKNKDNCKKEAENETKHPPASPATNMKTKIKKLTWDEALPRHLENEFREWIKELKDIIGYKVERYIFGKTKRRIQTTSTKR